MSDSEFTYSVLSMNVLMFRKHKRYKTTVDTLRDIAVA